jgi:hypothetical protein
MIDPSLRGPFLVQCDPSQGAPFLVQCGPNQEVPFLALHGLMRVKDVSHNIPTQEGHRPQRPSTGEGPLPQHCALGHRKKDIRHNNPTSSAGRP